ncbi:hypothetical protein [Streptomyces parvulus]|uniref:hypothetical protein n=1 Tax=Streptomyces parvulus TaxID=146923 RepID=UPI0036FD180B
MTPVCFLRVFVRRQRVCCLAVLAVPFPVVQHARLGVFRLVQKPGVREPPGLRSGTTLTPQRVDQLSAIGMRWA